MASRFPYLPCIIRSLGVTAKIIFLELSLGISASDGVDAKIWLSGGLRPTIREHQCVEFGNRLAPKDNILPPVGYRYDYPLLGVISKLLAKVQVLRAAGVTPTPLQDSASTWSANSGGLLHESQVLSGATSAVQLPVPEMPHAPVPSEIAFYSTFGWCLNPRLTVDDVVAHLREQLQGDDNGESGWQIYERAINAYLLACALLNAIDDYIEGSQYRLPRPLRRSPLAAPFRAMIRLHRSAGLRLMWLRRTREIYKERQAWQEYVDEFLRWFVGLDSGKAGLDGFIEAAAKLARAPDLRLPRDLARRAINIPSAFRKQDLTHHDVLALARRLAAKFPDKQRPILIVGLRSAGSYFAPLLSAFLKTEGYETVKDATIRPEAGVPPHLRAEFAHAAAVGHLVVLVDDPPYTGGTIAQGLQHLRRLGFPPGQAAILFPVRPVGRNWDSKDAALVFGKETIVTLAPEEWHKSRFLRSDDVKAQLRRYFTHRHYTRVSFESSQTSDMANRVAEQEPELNERYRLKRIFTIKLEDANGISSTRHVVVKSVGWGFFGYSAFLLAHRLADQVPPLLGLRDGLIYLEWLAHQPNDTEADRSKQIETIAGYVAARATRLRLGPRRIHHTSFDPHRSGLQCLSEFLSKAYGSAAAAKLREPELRRAISQLQSPLLALIDGRMEPKEWAWSGSRWKKVDFEHHGFGKHEVNIEDPAYDLADSLLHFDMTPDEEQDLLRVYVEKSGDHQIRQRLTFAKLIAGSWALSEARENTIKHPQRARDWARHYFLASAFLTRELARFCGTLVPPSAELAWRNPLIVLDIDGVLDTRRFDVPTTTLSGVKALRQLHAHGFAIVVDSARSAREIADYCHAYHLAGGVAEYGSYIFDAINGRSEVLVTDASLSQLDILRDALSQIPGVFLNECYTYSIRACAFERGRPNPLPFHMIPELISRLKLDRLNWIQTSIDSTVIAKEVNKARGLKSLLHLAGAPDLDITAVGDSEPDLPLFAIAKRSFSPAHIGCGATAAMVGAQISHAPYQRGLLEIVAGLTDGYPRSPDYSTVPIQVPHHDETLLRMLAACDRPWPSLLLRSLLSPRIFRALKQ